MKKGISLIVLMITIAVSIILVSTIVVTGTSVYNNTKKIKFASELSYVEESISSYLLNNGEYPTSSELDLNTSEISEDILIEQFKDEEILNNNIELYEIDFSKLGMIEINLADKEYTSDKANVYLISKKTGKVYYKKGYKVGKNIYYTLNDELRKIINYVDKSNINDGIIFNKTDEKIDGKVSVNIKIPSSYIVESITSNCDDFSYNTNNSDEYVQYTTLSSTNSVITITYKISDISESKVLKYSINTADNTKPAFELSDIKTLESATSIKKYIEIVNLQDTISGIKTIKYANENVSEEDAKEYFFTKGITVENNIIFLNNDFSEITVYVEDNAGNYSIKSFLRYNYITNGLILWYDGINNTRNGNNPNSTIWEDLSGNNNDGKLINTNNTIIYKGNGYEFTNNNDYIESINKLSLDGDIDFTVEVLCKWYGLQNSQQMCGTFWFGNTATIEGASICITFNAQYTNFTIMNNGIRAFAPKIGNINSIAISKAKGDFDTLNNSRIYMNGMDSYVMSYGNKVEMNVLNSKIQVGRAWQWGAQNRTLNGVIYAVRVYNRTLNEDEIKQNYNIDKERFNIK